MQARMIVGACRPGHDAALEEARRMKRRTRDWVRAAYCIVSGIASMAISPIPRAASEARSGAVRHVPAVKAP